MRTKRPTGFALVWGTIGPLSVLLGGTIVLHTIVTAQQPSYRVFDPMENRYRDARKRIPRDRRPRHRRRTLSY